MGKHTLLLIALFSFAFIGCVETLINVTVFPDGRYHMKIVSKGDKEDIDNNDFVHPYSSDWKTEKRQEENDESNQPVHILSSESLLNDTSLLSKNDVGALRYPISVKFNKGVFSDTYILHQIFEGRAIDKKYPTLASALNKPTDQSSELMVQTEVVMYCLSKSMDDIDSQFEIEQLLKERMLNHFNGVFYKAEEDGQLLDIFKSNAMESVDMINIPMELIRSNFKPFEDLLPAQCVDACIESMRPYIYEANVTIQLNDDSFKFASTLPGAIFESNADSTSNDTLWWYFDLKDFMNDSYTIEAASIVYYPERIQKAVVLGTLIILFVLFLIAKRKAIS